MKELRIGFALTGSFCTIGGVYGEIEKLAAETKSVTPIVSETVDGHDTRFQTASEIKERLLAITGQPVIRTIVEAEPIGPKKLLDALIVAPCTGNTLAKIACGITDTSVTMAVKAHLRNKRPVVLAVSTNDGLAGNAKNIAMLLNTKNIYFVPFYQDDITNKESSLQANLELIIPTLQNALQGNQLQPIL